MAADVIEQVRRGEMTGPPACRRPLGVPRAVDKQGRITIDDKLRTYARLQPGSQVVVSGNLNRAEVWSEDLYERVAAAGRGELAGGRSEREKACRRRAPARRTEMGPTRAQVAG